ncbi:thymidylate synthase [Rhodovibrio sodomensis]|uniref:Thymidylate synthase n=1 Tax=Rhodovibrio sodomensis TaxID=1088 RepID=A0ABS1D8X4_9PROT|nr:thymidylate synthase [Rhodovibrio sodomensis]MBK1666469.1 thymidylate synthase [Rhodovibrio sodomensis]
MDFETQYLNLLREIRDNGVDKGDRTGVGCRSLWLRTIRHDLANGFPLLTTKRVFTKGVLAELLWFLTGDTNIQPLVQQGVSIWTDWPLARYNKTTGSEVSKQMFEQWIAEDDRFAKSWGDLGPVYGKQWVAWEGMDGEKHNQIQSVVDTLKTDPNSRRILFSGWNVPDLPDMALVPCHVLYQFSTIGGRLNAALYQRSCDTLLGVPFNIASLAFLTHMIAHQTGYEPGEIVWVGADVHLYSNHWEQVEEQLSREPRPLPKLSFARKPDSIFGYTREDFLIEGYAPHEAIKAKVAV